MDIHSDNFGKEIVIANKDIEVVQQNYWWDINRSWKRNCLLNFITGTRGVGKTYGALKRVYEQWKANGTTGIYIRRRQNELYATNGRLFAKHIKTGDIEELVKFDKGIYWICRGSTQETKPADTDIKDWEVLCYTTAISTAHTIKSVPYINPKIAVLDEFISERKTRKNKFDYLPDEPERLLNIMETVFRGDPEARVYCLANGYSRYNPYFLYFDISPDENSKNGITFFRKKGILIEEVNAEDFVQQNRLNTPFGRLIDGTPYGNFMLHNEAVGDKYYNIASFEGKEWKKSELYRLTMGGTVWSVSRVCKRDDKRKDERYNIFVHKSTTQKITENTYDITGDVIGGRKSMFTGADIDLYGEIYSAKYQGRFYFDSVKTASALSSYIL